MFLVSTVPSNQTTVNANAPQEALDTDGFIRKLQRFGTSGSTDELHDIAPYFNNGQLALGAEQRTQDSSLSMASETQKRKEDEKRKISELEHKKKGLALSRF